MRLLALNLSNFGIYGGEHRFNLKPQGGPIILFGGKNGTGKTTLLESIRLCLYGSRALGDRVSQTEYEEYLRKQIHRRRLDTLETTKAVVSLEFDYVHQGIKQHYTVNRTWEENGKSINEEFTVLENGEALSELRQERWQDFILDLIPPKISELFFFDGEKIQSLAADGTSDKALDRSIKGLLGLDIVETLQIDLATYVRQQHKQSGIPELVEEVENAERDRDLTEKRYQKLKQERSQTQVYIDQILAQIDEVERKIARESKGYALERESLRDEISRLEGEREAAKRTLHNMAGELMPFALVPQLCLQLTQQLDAEAQYQQWVATQRWITPQLESIEDTLQSDEFLAALNGDLSLDLRKQIAQTVLGHLGDLTRIPEELEGINLVHNFSDPERIQLMGWVEQAVNEVPGKVHDTTERLIELTYRQEEAQRALRQVPDDVVLAPLLEKLNLHDDEYRSLEKQLDEQDSLLGTITLKLEEATRQLQKAYEALKANKRQKDRLALAERTQAALEDFLNKLSKKKLQALEQLVTDRFNQLSRKQELINRIEINPVDFNIILYDSFDIPVSKSQLSAGEKQIYAVAMLWALRQLSGRPLPVIIDTPLGRLDSDHRQHLITHYFPYTSHQVIILSTDTEIDQGYFKELSPHISHAYHLEFDPKSGTSVATEGYFWQEGAHATQ